MEHIVIMDFGFEHCAPDKGATLHPFRHNVLHFVFSGSGDINGQKVSAGEMFLCRGGEHSVYAPDPLNPWYYGWIGGSGLLFEQLLSDMHFSQDITVCTMQNSALVELLIRLGTSSKEQEYRCGLFWAIAGLQTGDNEDALEDMPRLHVKDAEQYIESVSGNTTPQEVADHLHLSRAYLRNLFSISHGISLQKYILRYRMQRAAELLAETNLPIGTIGQQVGYQDPLMFSKMFHKYRHMSPTAYRKSTIVFMQAVTDARKHDPRYRGENIEYLRSSIVSDK